MVCSKNTRKRVGPNADTNNRAGFQLVIFISHEAEVLRDTEAGKGQKQVISSNEQSPEGQRPSRVQ